MAMFVGSCCRDPGHRTRSEIERCVIGEERREESEAPEELEELKLKRPPRARLSPEESLKRMEEFPKRRDKFVAAVRKGSRYDCPISHRPLSARAGAGER